MTGRVHPAVLIIAYDHTVYRLSRDCMMLRPAPTLWRPTC